MTHDRLFEAYYQLHRLRECDFPAPLQSAFQSIISNMTCRTDSVSQGQPGRMGDVRQTLRHLNPDEARQIVASITQLIEELGVLIARDT